jgi:hypothetical protein
MRAKRGYEVLRQLLVGAFDGDFTYRDGRFGDELLEIGIERGPDALKSL